MRNRGRIWLAAVGLGVANAVVYKVFEYLVNHGTNWLWNESPLNTDEHRWVVVPLALVLSVLFTVVLRLLKKPRWLEPATSLFDEKKKKEKRPTTLGDIGSILTQGLSGLLAGASLGPEMPLTESSEAIGKWTVGKMKTDASTAAVLVAASIGSLMVAFLGSLLMVLLPLALIYKQGKRLTVDMAVPIVLAALSAFGTLWLMDHNTEGYGSIPAIPQLAMHDFVAAFVVALLISAAALGLVRLIGYLGDITRRLDLGWPWWASAALFGLVLGLLYLLGGQSIQFNGSEGSKLLLHNAAHYGTWAFLGLAIAKLLATAWSKTTGYRGGLYFPSIYVSLAIGLFVEALDPALSGPGAIIGAVAAIFTALSFPARPQGRRDYATAVVIAFLFMAALLPAKLLPLAVVAMVAAVIGNKLLLRFIPSQQT